MALSPAERARNYRKRKHEAAQSVTPAGAASRDDEPLPEGWRASWRHPKPRGPHGKKARIELETLLVSNEPLPANPELREEMMKVLRAIARAGGAPPEARVRAAKAILDETAPEPGAAQGNSLTLEEAMQQEQREGMQQ